MQATIRTLHCDAEDCTSWSVDYYAETVSQLGDTRVTATQRAPGWVSTPDGDFCPAHNTTGA